MSTRTRIKRRGGSIGHYVPPDPLAAAAHELGMQRNSVEQLCYGRDNIFERMEVIVRFMVQCGQGARAARLLARIDSARQPFKAEFTVELAREELEADLDEDKAKAEYFWNPSRETWQAYRKALVRESYTNQLTIQAGDRKWGTH